MSNKTAGAIRPVRTLSAAIVGGMIGAVFAGALGYAVSDEEGLSALGILIVTAGLGALGGVSVAMAIEMRDRPIRSRVMTILTVLVVGPPLCALVAWGIAQTFMLDTRLIFVVCVGLVLPATALLGRWFASRSSPGV